MNITLTVTLADEVLALVRAFFNNAAPATAAPAVAAAPKAEKKTTKAVAVELQHSPAAVGVDPANPEAEAVVVSIEEVRAAVSAKAQAGKRAEVKDLLNKFGADKVTSLKSEKYAEFLAEINAL